MLSKSSPPDRALPDKVGLSVVPADAVSIRRIRKTQNQNSAPELEALCFFFLWNDYYILLIIALSG